MQSFDPANTLAAVAGESPAQTYQNPKYSVVVPLEQCFSEGLLLMQMTSQRLWRLGQVNHDSSVSRKLRSTPPRLLGLSHLGQRRVAEQLTIHRQKCRTFVPHPGRYDYISGNSSF